ncbi:MAG: 2-oxoacid:acceptor oxidoreductase family protein [Gemmatimonadales bacterium]|jgi:2-oxoisovalerate ferredoxin oxidoreductase beta subunit
MSTVFYERFERHAHGEGLKGHSTHYCPGCGHGLIHKYLAEAIDELGVQDRTVAISPVGCAVFMYYYLDVGNAQAAHGRAPAVAIGHKMANPGAIVVSYQGDGDLAAIGLAEIIQATQLGMPMTFIFINNAIYGMTGGQLAPTTLMEQRTTTSPMGRNRLMGEPIKMAETIGQLDGPVYVERCALYDNKQRTRAKKAIKKALRLQVENKGLGFVEVLSECPTHLKATTSEAEQWIKDNMVPVFPLGVKKDVEAEPWFDMGPPKFDAESVVDVVGSSAEPPQRFGKGFPAHIDQDDVSIKFAGAGGDGAQTIALLTTRTAINEGFDSTHIPSYGPESRGGTSYADVHIATHEVLSPASPEPHVLVAFNPPSLEKFGPDVRAGGIVIYDSSVIPSPPELDPSLEIVGVPCAQIAIDLGKAMVKNVVALGAMQAATRLFPKESFLYTMRQALQHDCSLLALNEEAFAWGEKSYQEATS